jgi:flagellar assembly protein FliH
MSTNAAFSSITFPALVSIGAEEEIERARVHGHAAGYAAGLRAAAADAQTNAERARLERDALRADAATALRSALAALEAATTAVASSSELVLADADQALTAAAIELAESIIGRELSSDETSARVAVARALTGVDPSMVVDVRLNPIDLAVLGASELASSVVNLIADPGLDRGDAVVDVPSGRIDARISSALERARTEIGVIR